MQNDFYSKLVVEACRWVELKVPYKHRGISIHGCDCTGFVIGLLKSLGYLQNYKLREYPLDWNLHSGAGEYIINELSQIADEIDKKDIQPGDILIFRFGRCLSHSGIFIRQNLFAHSYLSAKRCSYGILQNSIYTKRWVKAFRFNLLKLKDF